jgi:outer membrane protein, heavy metal efflux system
MNVMLKSFSMVALLCGLCGVQAQEANAPTPGTSSARHGMGLAELTRAMLERNPQLRGAKWSADAVRMGVSPAGAPDNPTVSMLQDQVRNNPLAWNKAGSASWTWSQNIYWPGKKSLNAQVVSDQADAQQAQTLALQSQLLGQMRSTWLSWQSTQAQLALLQAQVAKMEQIKDITKIRYGQNAAAFADYINAQVMQEQLRTSIISTQLQADTLLGQMANLIGQDSPQGLVVKIEDLSTPPEAPTLAEWERRALEQHPLIKASAAAVQQARHSLELAELNKRPDFNMAVSGYANQPPWGLTSNSAYAFSVGMTFPLWYEQKEKFLINQAELQLRSNQENDASQRQQISLGVRSAWLQWKQNLEQYQLFEKSILQQARLAYRLTLKNYSVGQNSYVDLLNAFNAERGAEANAIQARANVWLAQAALKAAAGDINPQNQP